MRFYVPLMLAVMGCSDGRVMLPTAPIAGTVTYQEKLLDRGRIVFFHESGKAAATDLGTDDIFKLAAFEGKTQAVTSVLIHISRRPIPTAT